MAAALVIAGLVGSAAQADRASVAERAAGRPDDASHGSAVSRSATPECRDARRGLAYYQARARYWRTRMGAEGVRMSLLPRVAEATPRACPHIRRLAAQARTRARMWHGRYERWYAYAWRDWLPQVWKAIIQCETASNFRYSNSSYEGAFGFAKVSWDSFKPRGYPEDAWQATPREQYVVSLAIHARFGFSGWGCA